MTNPITNQEEKTILLRGGPADGTVQRVPKGDWNLFHQDGEEKVRYVRVGRIEVWASDDDTTIYLES